MIARTVGASLCVGTLLLAPATFAQSETRAAVAEGLYRQARDLMAAGNFDEACPKFAESQRLDPATGTLLNLAACHEKQGKLATAWIEYSDALFAARRDGREDRVDYARQRAAELEPKLSRLTLQLDAGADHAGLEIELDGAALGRAVVGAPMPIDPGKHTLRVSAPGKQPWTQSIEVAALSDQKVLSIPPLADAPPEPAAAVTPTPAGVAAPVAGPPRDEVGPRPVPTSVYLSGGITVALGVGAVVSGVAYLNKKEAYDAKYDEGPSAALESLENKADRYGYLNLGLWAATAVGAGVTTYLYVTRPALPRTARVAPWATHESAGLSVMGDF